MKHPSPKERGSVTRGSSADEASKCDLAAQNGAAVRRIAVRFGLGLAGVAAVATLAILIFPRRSAEPVVELANPPAVEPLSTAPQAAPPAVDPSPPAAAAPRKQPSVAPATVRQPVPSVMVRADQVLATVNGQRIQLKELVPLGPDDAEKAMTTEEYRSRLNRAIELELTAQAAQAQGVGLSAEQRQRLARIGQNHKARLQEYQQQGISWSSVTTAQLEFERRLMSALMLQQNLVAQEAAVAPSPDGAVQARYEQALRDLLARLKASANVSSSGN